MKNVFIIHATLIAGIWIVSVALSELKSAEESVKAHDNRALPVEASSVVADSSEVTSCERLVTLKLSQSHFTLNVMEHTKDALNAVEFQLPVACRFYQKIQVGDDLLSKRFRAGSLLIRGSAGRWNLMVVDK